MVEGGSVRDVGEYGSCKYGAVFEALGDKVGEVDCCVDANGCEGCCGVCTSRDFGFREDAEVGDDVFEPRVCGEEFIEPLACGGFGIFVTVQDDSI